jgi:hypothetical protein
LPRLHHRHAGLQDEKKPGNFLPGFGMEGTEMVYFLTKVSASAQVGHFFGLQRLSFS